MMSQRISRKVVSLGATASVLLLLFCAASMRFDGFCSRYVVADLFSENAHLGIVAIGMTLVILSGGIDLSVGSVVGFTSIFVATLISEHGWSPWLAWLAALLVGTSFGAAMGAMIEIYQLPAFLVTLAGMFFMRGMAFVVKHDAVRIDHAVYESLGDIAVPLGGGAELGVAPLLFLGLLLATVFVTDFTRFGRNIYAVGGNEESACLMGLPVTKTKILVYLQSGACAALAGVVLTLYMDSGNPTAATALELDAIAVVVIGGTLLAGGVGSVWGTLLGFLIYATIYQVTFFASLRSSIATIVIGVLLLGFIGLQELLVRGSRAGGNR